MDLLTEIAVSYYEHELTQEEIANRFNISRVKIGRLLKKARQEGIVEINVKYHPIFTSKLEQRLIEQFGIHRALIAIDTQNEVEQRKQSRCVSKCLFIQYVKRRYDSSSWARTKCSRRWRICGRFS